MARDRGGPQPAFQMLIYLITDHDLDNASYRECAEGFFLTRSEMAWYWEQYVERLELAGTPTHRPAGPPT